jgi:hypothetical protein
MITNYSTRSFLNPADGTALHCSDVFPELIHFEDWTEPLLLTDWLTD